MRLTEASSVQGRITIRSHRPQWRYRRDQRHRGLLLHDGHNTIQVSGYAYLCQMLMADPLGNQPRKYGITQISVENPGGEVYKADVTDQFTSGATITSVLYVPASQPTIQPTSLVRGNLYLDDGGATLMAKGDLTPILKTNTIAVTIEWTISFSQVA